MTTPPLKAMLIPVTPLQQNCTLFWCTQTMRGAFVDPGGDLPVLKRAAPEQAGVLARDLGVTIEGPHEEDRFWIERLAEDGKRWGVPGESFEPDRWLQDGDQVTVGNLTFDVIHCPGHTPGHVVFHHAPSKLAIVGDVLFQGSIGRTDFPRGNHQDLIDAITGKLWPLGGDTAFVPGHGAMSNFAHERRTNPFVADSVLAG